MSGNLQSEGTIEALKSSPPVAIGGLTLGGVTFQDWVYILTIIYLIMQIGWFAYSKFIKTAPANAPE